MPRLISSPSGRSREGRPSGIVGLRWATGFGSQAAWNRWPRATASQGMPCQEASAMRFVARLKIASDRSTPVEPLRNAREITFNYT